MQNVTLDESQAGIKIAERNINNLRYADDTTLLAESGEKLKSLLMNMKEENEEAGLKLNIPKTKIMHPVHQFMAGRKMGIKWKQWQTTVVWAPKSLWTVTAAMKLKKKTFAPWKKSMMNLDSVLKKAETSLRYQRSV